MDKSPLHAIRTINLINLWSNEEEAEEYQKKQDPHGGNCRFSTRRRRKDNMFHAL